MSTVENAASAAAVTPSAAVEVDRRAVILWEVATFVVFLVGMGLLIASGVLVMSGQRSPEQLYGSGIAFVSGLGTMLLIVYTGPLKEIRRSVSDLGIASAAFIAYVHRVLETSHTFTFYYLRQQITFDEMKKSGDLIASAMMDTIQKLHQDDKSSLEVIRKAIESPIRRTGGGPEEDATGSSGKSE